MRVLVAEDEPVSRRALEAALEDWGYEVLVSSNGAQAWDILRGKEAPELGVIDWMMPKMDGPALCRRVRELAHTPPVYIILLTARDAKDDIVGGLDAGADDYITKPFHREELRARLQVGRRIVELQKNLAVRVNQLEQTLRRVKRLQGLLPICSYCKRVRDDRNYWQAVEAYISEHSEAEFSHGICPDCYEKVVKSKFERTLDSRE